MFPTKIFRIVALVFGALMVILAFILLGLKGESDTCHEAGFGDYDEMTGACAINGKYASNVIVVAGNTANSPKPTFDKAKNTIAYNYLKNSIAMKSNIKVISAANDLSLEPITIKYNESNDASGFISSINGAIADINTKISAAPKSDGASYLEAISKAGYEVPTSLNSAKDSNDEGTAIIVIGSGLSDSGILNFARTSNLLSMQPYEVVGALSKTGQLTRTLGGVKIIWSGLGQVVSPQGRLSESDKKNLADIYNYILTSKGAKEVVFDTSDLGNESVETNHTVEPTRVSFIPCNPFELDSEEQLSFKGGSAEIEDETKALSALSTIISSALTNPNVPITVTGYMAPIDCNNSTDWLSMARANAVKSLLQKAGVKNVIITEDGRVWEPEKSVCNADGTRNEEIAKTKRKVVIKFEGECQNV